MQRNCRKSLQGQGRRRLRASKHGCQRCMILKVECRTSTCKWTAVTFDPFPDELTQPIPARQICLICICGDTPVLTQAMHCSSASKLKGGATVVMEWAATKSPGEPMTSLAGQHCLCIYCLPEGRNKRSALQISIIQKSLCWLLCECFMAEDIHSSCLDLKDSHNVFWWNKLDMIVLKKKIRKPEKTFKICHRCKQFIWHCGSDQSLAGINSLECSYTGAFIPTLYSTQRNQSQMCHTDINMRARSLMVYNYEAWITLLNAPLPPCKTSLPSCMLAFLSSSSRHRDSLATDSLTVFHSYFSVTQFSLV